MRTDRLQALADGIFAIALTLLVLGLPAPHGSSRLAADLVHAWPSYAAYTVSFVTVGIVWVNHHQQLDHVVRADRTLLELNLLLLAFVAVVPWPTGLLAEYVREPRQSSAAAVTYGLVMTGMAAAFTGVWLWLRQRPHLLEPGFVPRLRGAIRRSLVGPAAYAVAVAVAVVSAPVAFVLFAAVPVFFWASGRRTGTPVPGTTAPPD